MIRIAYVVDHLQVGGAQRHLLQVIRGLDRERYYPEMWTTSEDPGELAPEFEANGVDVRSFGIRSTLMSSSTITACRRVATEFRESGVQIVHGYLFEGNLLGAIAGRMARCPIILTSKRSLDRYTRWDRRAAAWWSNRVSNRVLVNSTAVRDVVLEHERCPASRLKLIPNGVAPPPPTLVSSRSPGDDERGPGPLVGMVGRLGWKKGYEYALDAFALLRSRIPGLRVDIVGDGDLRAKLARRTTELGLDGTVRFLGRQDNVADHMRRFDCFVLSSVVEGMPNALLEAMALGRPAVTTSAGGSGEIPVDGESGLIVPPRDAAALADAVERVLTDEMLAQRLSRAAVVRVQNHFSERAMLGALDALYRDEASRVGLPQATEAPDRIGLAEQTDGSAR